MKEIIEVLNEVKEGVDFENEKNLITDGILTSFDLIMLISALNNKFGVNITAAELVPENFESVEAIKKLIDSLK
jgi:acyl carrier protein